MFTEHATCTNSALFKTRENTRLNGHVVKQFQSPSFMSCNHWCLGNSWCTSTNFRELSEVNKKGICELNKHGYVDQNTNLDDEKGVTFSLLVKRHHLPCAAGLTGPLCQYECNQQKILNDSDRHSDFGRGDRKCDNHLTEDWYRFSAGAGTSIPTHCLPHHRCGTDLPGWMDGAHPTVDEGVVSRKVCFHGYECNQYKILNDSDRRNDFGRGDQKCDNYLAEDWYRFSAGAGTSMATQCIPDAQRCGTDLTGWMDGAHPTVNEGVVSRK
ncbi:unnamed protein product, partial [Pocillopora meandrina]